MGDRLLFGHNGLQKIQAPFVGLVEIHFRTQIEPARTAGRRRGRTRHRLGRAGRSRRAAPRRARCTHRPPPRRVPADRHASASLSDAPSATMSTNSCWIVAACSIPRATCRTAGGWSLATAARKRRRVSRNAVGHPGQPLADRPPVVIGVGWHQVEHVAHRLQRRCDHVQLADVESRVVQLELDAESFPHRGERHDVDVVLGGDAVQLAQRRAGGIGTRGYTVGGVVGDVGVIFAVLADDAHFRCRAGIQRGERREIAFGYSIDCCGAPTQGRAWRRCRTCSGRRSGIRS